MKKLILIFVISITTLFGQKIEAGDCLNFQELLFEKIVKSKTKLDREEIKQQFISFMKNPDFSDCYLKKMYNLVWSKDLPDIIFRTYEYDSIVNSILLRTHNSSDYKLLSLGFNLSFEPMIKKQNNINLFRYKDFNGKIHFKDFTNFDNYSNAQCAFIDEVHTDSINKIDYYFISCFGANSDIKHHLWSCLLKCSNEGVFIIEGGLSNKSTIIIEQNLEINEFCIRYLSETKMIEYYKTHVNDCFGGEAEKPIQLKFTGEKFELVK